MKIEKSIRSTTVIFSPVLALQITDKNEKRTTEITNVISKFK